MRMGWLCAAALALALGPARADDRLEVDLRFWFPGFGGSAQATDAGVIGTVVDFEDDLGMDSDMVVEPRVTWKLSRRHWLRFSYANVGGDGDQVSTIPITFMGTTYPATTRLVTDFDADLFRVGWGWNLFDTDRFHLASIFTAGFGSGEASIAAPGTALGTESDSIDFPLIMLGVGTGIDLGDAVTLFGEFGGLPLGSLGHLWDGEIGVRYTPTDWLGLTTGFRALEIRVKDTDSNDQARIQSGGWFFSANASF